LQFNIIRVVSSRESLVAEKLNAIEGVTAADPGLGGYVYVRLDDENLAQKVRKTFGFIKFVMSGPKYAVVDYTPPEPEKPKEIAVFAIGSPVIVIDGPFKGQKGIVASQDGDQAEVSIQMFGKFALLRMSVDWIEINS